MKKSPISLASIVIITFVSSVSYYFDDTVDRVQLSTATNIYKMIKYVCVSDLNFYYMQFKHITTIASKAIPLVNFKNKRDLICVNINQNFD